MSGMSGTSEDAIVYEVVYPHPIERVWHALTDSQALAAWLMPNDFSLHLGHRFTFRVAPGHGWSGIIECEVAKLAAPTLLAYTWRDTSGLLDTLVTFTLATTEDGTRLRLEHSGFMASGPTALSIRDLLSSGWRSKLLRERLPAQLDRLASSDMPSSINI